jgi:hypothetical protein
LIGWLSWIEQKKDRLISSYLVFLLYLCWSGGISLQNAFRRLTMDRLRTHLEQQTGTLLSRTRFAMFWNAKVMSTVAPTLNTLVVYVNEQLHIPISRSQLAEVLKQEGLRWYQEKTYFFESPDPQFVKKGGDREPVSVSTPCNPCDLCG